MVVIARFWSKFQKKNEFFLIFFEKYVILQEKCSQGRKKTLTSKLFL
jgi:hypothetical protein